MTNTTNDTRFEMLYCDNIACRVNTFERGEGGECPACKVLGEVLD